MSGEDADTLLFVTYTGEPRKDAKNSLTRVRRHVMRKHLSKRQARVQTRPRSGVDSDDKSPAHARRGISRHVQSSVDSVLQRNGSALQRQIPQGSLSLNILNSMDPFDVLPVPGCATLHDLAHWHFYSPTVIGAQSNRDAWTRKLDLARSQVRWQFALENEAVFQSMLCGAAVKKGCITNSPDTTTTYLYHKVEGLKSLRKRLSGMSSDMVCPIQW